MNIIGTGLSGLIGSKVVELMSESNVFEDMSFATGIDITNFDLVNQMIEKSPSEWVFHFAAYTDVDKAEVESGDRTGICWKVNVDATEHIVNVSKKYKKKVLYLSTDYVFDGLENSYAENHIPSPKGWYAQTKYEGEKKVLESDDNIVIRIANPYRSNPIGKTDFVHKIVERLTMKQQILSPTDQLFIPTFIDDIVMAIQILISKQVHGIFHVVGATVLSPYAAALEIADMYGLSKDLVQPTTFETFFTGRASRPMKAVLTHDKITKLGISMKPFHEGLKTVRLQELKEEKI